MKKIIFNTNDEGVIPFSCVDKYAPIFAKVDDKLVGMVVNEQQGWIVRIGGNCGASGYHETLEGCIKACYRFGYEFFTY